MKRFLIVVLLIAAGLFFYIQIINKNSPEMTGRQKALKAFYPLFMGITKLTKTNTMILTNEKKVIPPNSFYQLQITLNNGQALNFDSLRGKKVLLVNTASDCGYTNQYEDLQKLQVQFKDKLVVIGFPANDFKEQEKRDDKAIAEFCKINFGVTFPLAQKNTVLKTADQQLVFQWLSNKDKNGWNTQAPTWNFSKYLVDENGVLTHYFDPSISPMDAAVTKEIE